MHLHGYRKEQAQQQTWCWKLKVRRFGGNAERKKKQEAAETVCSAWDLSIKCIKECRLSNQPPLFRHRISRFISRMNWALLHLPAIIHTALQWDYALIVLRCFATETSQRSGEHADEVHPALYPLHQTQRDQETKRLGGEQASILTVTFTCLLCGKSL